MKRANIEEAGGPLFHWGRAKGKQQKDLSVLGRPSPVTAGPLGRACKIFRMHRNHCCLLGRWCRLVGEVMLVGKGEEEGLGEGGLTGCQGKSAWDPLGRAPYY